MLKYTLPCIAAFLGCAISIARTNPDPDYIQIYNEGLLVKMAPHGLGETPAQDTINLQWVFDNFPNADILLSTGTFQVDKTIEAVNYQGSIIGQGPNKTFIIGRGPYNAEEGLYVFPLLNADLTDRLYPSSVPHLFWFHPLDNGNVNDWPINNINLTIKNLTISLTGVGPAITYLGSPVRSIWSLIAISAADAVLTAEVGNIPHIQFDFDNIVMTAEITTYTLDGVVYINSNAGLASIVYGAEQWVESDFGLNGFAETDHMPCNMIASITNCTFNSFWAYGIGLEAAYTANTGSTYTFPTNPAFPPSSFYIHNNTFNSISTNPFSLVYGQNLFILNPSEAGIDIGYNTFNNVNGAAIGFLRGVVIGIEQKSSIALVHHNTFNLTHNVNDTAGVQIVDNATENQMNIIVQNNYFSAPSEFEAAFIEGYIASGCSFLNNLCIGSGPAAVSLGNTPNLLTEEGIPNPFGPILPGADCTIVGNDFSLFDASVANIILGPESSGNTAIVRHASDVQNSGTDNTIIVI